MSRDKYPKPTTISALKLYKKKGDLSIPDVQRDLVWATSQKQLLIDSLLKNFDIPKLYFRDISVDGKTKYEVVDGQQRLNAIFDFLNDEYSLPSDFDPIDGEEVAKKKWSELSSDLQVEFESRSLDIVHLIDYNQEEMEETFLRLQNGTPLKAPEKRRAISGNMRDVVCELSKHKVFANYCSFENVHYAYEDVTAKALKQVLEGGPTTISALSLKRMYEQNKTIEITNKEPQSVKRAYNFIAKSFSHNDNPHLKKYAIADLSIIVNGLLSIYDLQNYATEFGKVYLDFDNARAINKEKDEEEQDQRLIAYGNAARGDSLEFLEYRQNLLREYILEKMPYLAVKDNNRNFTSDQRAVIYRLGNGICAVCGEKVSEEEFEADHKKPWSKGGLTQIANGQVLCSNCNKHKSDKDMG